MTLAENYHEIMNRIELTPEGRARILDGVRQAELAGPARARMIQFPQWKRWAAVAACAAVVLLAAVTLQNQKAATAPNESQGSVQIANPFEDYDTLADAARAVGFELTVPERIDGFSGDKTVQVMSGTTIQIIYSDGSDNRLFIRKAPGSEDISGDYNKYDEIRTAAVNGCDVTLKGSSGAVSTAVWTSGGYSYAVSADVPLRAEAMTALIAQIA